MLSAFLFCIGIYGVLARRNGVLVLMSIELMLNAVNINLVAFSARLNDAAGQVFALFVIAIAAAEVGVGLAIVLLIYRNRVGVNLDEIDLDEGLSGMNALLVLATEAATRPRSRPPPHAGIADECLAHPAAAGAVVLRHPLLRQEAARRAAESGILAVGASFVLALLVAAEWISNHAVVDQHWVWWRNGDVEHHHRLGCTSTGSRP